MAERVPMPGGWGWDEAALRAAAHQASAGTTSSGAIDPLDEIADVCARHGVWFHVDGARSASMTSMSMDVTVRIAP